MDPELIGETREVKAGVQLARLEVRSQTFNKETLDVEISMGSGVGVVRGGFFTEPFIEELSMDPAHIRMGRMQSGKMPLLNSHNRWDLEAQIGVVRSGRIENGQMVFSSRLSRRDECKGIVQDVADGIIRNSSLGYRVYHYKDVTKDGDRMKRRLADDWEPMEGSLVTVPADETSDVRGTDGLPLEARGNAPTETRAQDGTVISRAEDAWHTCTIEGRKATKPMDPEELKRLEAERAAQAAKPAGAGTAVLEKPADQEAIRKAGEDATRAAQARSSEVLRLAAQHGLDAKWAQRIVDDPAKFPGSVEIQRAALEALSSRSDSSAGTSHVSVGRDASDKVRDAAEGALLHRLGVIDKLPEGSRDFGSIGIKDMAREFFRLQGVNTLRLSLSDFADLALHGATRDGSIRGLMSTSDFAQLLSNVQNKRMRKSYEGTPQTWLSIANRSEAPDFKPMRRIQLSNGTGLTRVNEHGEVPRGSMSDQAENYGLNTEGVIYGFTRRAFLNDDLGELDRVTRRMGVRAAERRSDLVWGMVIANPLMADGLAVHESTVHKNIHAAGAGSALQLSSLTTGQTAMRRQTDLDGKSITVYPEILVVPPELEVTAKQLTTQITPALLGSVNPFIGVFKQVIVEPRLTSATAWWMFADPNKVDGIEYAELAGAAGPQTAMRNGFEVDGIEFRILDDFGVAFLEYVSSFRSPGA